MKEDSCTGTQFGGEFAILVMTFFWLLYGGTLFLDQGTQYIIYHIILIKKYQGASNKNNDRVLMYLHICLKGYIPTNVLVLRRRVAVFTKIFKIYSYIGTHTLYPHYIFHRVLFWGGEGWISSNVNICLTFYIWKYSQNFFWGRGGGRHFFSY